MATLQEQARALGDPTRHAVFRAVAEASGPIGVAELTERFGLNHNAIRQHLAKLVAAGLVAEGTAPARGRGRPRLEYRVDPGAESRWGVVGPYERLSQWLAEVVRTGDSPREVGRRAGRAQLEEARTEGSSDEAGTDAASPSAPDPVAELVTQMARHGFEPTGVRTGDDVEVVLEACPFASTALTDPETVCQLHLGIAEGIAGSSVGLEVEELLAKDPRRAGCRLRAHVVPLDDPTRRRPDGAPSEAPRLVGRGSATTTTRPTDRRPPET